MAQYLHSYSLEPCSQCTNLVTSFACVVMWVLPHSLYHPGSIYQLRWCDFFHLWKSLHKWFLPLSAPLHVATPHHPKVLPSERKAPHLHVTKAPSQGNISWPSLHQTSHIYEPLSSYEMEGTPNSCEVYQCTPQICPTQLLALSFSLHPW